MASQQQHGVGGSGRYQSSRQQHACCGIQCGSAGCSAAHQGCSYLDPRPWHHSTMHSGWGLRCLGSRVCVAWSSGHKTCAHLLPPVPSRARPNLCIIPIGGCRPPCARVAGITPDGQLLTWGWNGAYNEDSWLMGDSGTGVCEKEGGSLRGKAAEAALEGLCERYDHIERACVAMHCRKPLTFRAYARTCMQTSHICMRTQAHFPQKYAFHACFSHALKTHVTQASWARGTTATAGRPRWCSACTPAPPASMTCACPTWSPGRRSRCGPAGRQGEGGRG